MFLLPHGNLTLGTVAGFTTLHSGLGAGKEQNPVPGVLWDWANLIQKPRDSVPWAPAVFYTCGYTTSIEKFLVIHYSVLHAE